MADSASEENVALPGAAGFPVTAAEAWLAAIVNSSDDAIIGKTLDSIIRSWNAAATRMFGYQPHEIVGKSVILLMPPELQHEEPDIIARLSRGDRVDHYETVRVRKDGTRIDVSLSVSPIRDSTGKIVGGAKIARDITEAKRLRKAERELVEQLQNLTTELEQQVEEGQSLQEELEQTNDELARSLNDAQDARRVAEEANSAKSRFLATMSHELRTPLNAIVGYVDLLEVGVQGTLNAAQQEYLARIRRSEKSLHRLIEDVLNFAKLESGKTEYHYGAVRLDEFLSGFETFVAPRLVAKRLAYRLHSNSDGVVVSIDREKAEQIVLNLLSNAVKFTQHGGIEVHCDVGPDTFRVSVCDTGPGIRRDLQATIFEPFAQGDRSLSRTTEGIGLGLSISRELARAMGGDVTLESTEGKGSTFSLVLPRAHTASPPAASA